MCCISNQAAHLWFKYYISNLGWVVKGYAAIEMQGGGVQNQGRLADAILEHFLIGN